MDTTRLLSPLWLGLLLAFPSSVRAEVVIDLDGTAPEGDETHFFVPFEVPADIAEIEVRHSSVASENILDFGLEDPNGFRGWGGGNTEPAVVGLDRASRSYVPGPIPAGTWRVVVGKAQLNVVPAQYTPQVILRTAAEATLAPQPERAPYEDPGALATGRRFYAGDFHVHSRESGDAHPTLDEIATVARANGLDFVVITDHNTHTALDFLNDAQTRHPDLLFIPGVEFTTYAGHANAIGATTWVNHRVGVDTTIDDAAAAYRAQGALFSINHPALSLGDLCIGCAWAHDLPDEAIDAVEIMTGATTVAQMAFLRPSVALWDGLCARGRHVAALGGSDDHRAGEGTGTLDSPIGSPTTMVEADELSVAAIVEGVRQGRTVVRITGMNAPMVVLGAREGLVGDTVTARRAHLELRVTGGQGSTLQLLKNGAPLGDAVTIDADPFFLSTEVMAPAEGEDRYRVEVVEARRQVTLTSHVYVRAPVDGGGCGVSATPDAGGHGALPWAAAALGMALALAKVGRRRGPQA